MHTRRFPELLPGFSNTQRLTVNFLFSLHHVKVMLGPIHTDINNINVIIDSYTHTYIYISVGMVCPYIANVFSLLCVERYVFIAFGHNSAMFGESSGWHEGGVPRVLCLGFSHGSHGGFG